mmetsp:Transcript_31581/g.68314  ORF Transcript_31581/g.68314 Transcript_31581/m.68314 type:complete len:123 (-) Transcript_31581:1024-1392(-)
MLGLFVGLLTFLPVTLCVAVTEEYSPVFVGVVYFCFLRPTGTFTLTLAPDPAWLVQAELDELKVAVTTSVRVILLNTASDQRVCMCKHRHHSSCSRGPMPNCRPPQSAEHMRNMNIQVLTVG